MPSIPARDRDAVLHPSSVLPTTPTCDFTGLALRPNILPRKRKGPKGEDPSTWGAQQACPRPLGSLRWGSAPHTRLLAESQPHAPGQLESCLSSAPLSLRLPVCAVRPHNPPSPVHGFTAAMRTADSGRAQCHASRVCREATSASHSNGETHGSPTHHCFLPCPPPMASWNRWKANRCPREKRLYQ